MKVGWEFNTGLEGWSNSSAEESQCEVYSRGGELRGRIRGATPNFDSPLFFLAATDHYYVVLRMAYHGFSTQGQVLVRHGLSMPPSRYATGDAMWDGGDFLTLDFDLIGDGRFHTYYVNLYNFRSPIPEVQHNITQLRLMPALEAAVGQSVKIDFIRIAEAPTILAVEGCSLLPEESAGDGIYPPSVGEQWIRPVGSLDQRFKYYNQTQITRGVGVVDRTLPFGITYNCLLRGGDRITLHGINFGISGARVSVNNRPCLNVQHHEAQASVSCTTPPGVAGIVNVTIAEGFLPGLTGTKPFLSYAIPAAGMPQPTISNIAAKSVHLNWVTSVDMWDALTITGYWIEQRVALDDTPANQADWVWSDWGSPVVTGNITVTTAIGLQEGTYYQWRIAPMTEDQTFSTEWQQLDLYGRRDPLPGFVRGEFSPSTIPTKTLATDFTFASFNANLTLNHGPFDARASLGPLGVTEGEGHFGLVLVGDTNVQNCNSSSTCCDGFDENRCRLSCSAQARVRPAYLNAVAQADEEARMGNGNVLGEVPRPPTNFPNGITVGPTAMLNRRPGVSCGPSLRLTSSKAKMSGAAWYNRKMQVREGFDTSFTFRLSDPSTHCKFLDDAYTHCRSRGGDGFAFVVQNQAPTALGSQGMQLGYGGIINSLAIEFDTWYNPETLDPMENHVSVHTRGWRDPNSSNHTYQLGATTQGVSDMSDLQHFVRILYQPHLDLEALDSESFMATPHMSEFVTNGDFPGGGQGDWGVGMGLLKVFVNSKTVPVLTVPLNIEGTLSLDNGRAWVGFTAATGNAVWQTHDILDWEFLQTRQDWARTRGEFPPDVVNGEGRHRCSGLYECIYPQ